jgi:hypothetical protein
MVKAQATGRPMDILVALRIAGFPALPTRARPRRKPRSRSAPVLLGAVIALPQVLALL